MGIFKNRLFSLTALCFLLSACGDSASAAAPGNQPGSRATIAVMGASDFVPDRNARKASSTVGLPDVLSSRIIEHLTNSKRFAPVERTALRRVVLEQRFGQNLANTYLDATLDKAISAMAEVDASTVAVTGGLANYNDLVKDFQDLGSAVGADYIVVGNLEKLTRSSRTTEVPFTKGHTSTANLADARLQIRVIDVVNGLVLGATSVRTQVSEAVFEGRQSDTDEYSFYDHLGQLASTKILDITYPAKIVSIEPFVISRGSMDGTNIGDVFSVSREGKEITDGSGQVIARLKSPVGSVKAVAVQETVTVVEVIGAAQLQIDDLVVTDTSTAAANTTVAKAESLVALQRGGGALPRLAVGFVKSGSTARTGAKADDHIPIFTDTLISRLTQTKRFQLIDRQEVDQLLDEQLAQALAENRDMPSAMGTLKGADYVALGNIDASSFTSETKTIQLPGSSRSFQETTWYVSGNMRIVDARSGDILESRKISIAEKPSQDMNKKRIATLLADAYSEQVVLMLMNAIYPIKVAAVGTDQTLYVNRGTDGGLSNGETLQAFRPGREIRDPDTGISLGYEEQDLGTVTLTEVEDARSKARAEVGTALQTGDILKRMSENRGQRAGRTGTAANQDTRSGKQLAGTADKSQGKDNKFTLAVGKILINPSARLTGLNQGHIKRMTDDLVVKLTNTNRFRVLERAEVDQLLDEKTFEALTSGGEVISRLRELMGADYLVHGEVTNFYINTTTSEVAFLDETESNSVAVTEGTIRLVDVHTGAVVGADNIRYETTANNVTDPTRLMSELIERYSTDSVAAIVLRLFPIKVLGQTADGSIYINRGQDTGIQVGTRFHVMRPGEEFVDPDTGLSFGAAESNIGTVEVVSVEASRAVTRFITGSGATSGDILRPAPPPAPEPVQEVFTPDF
jgi:curli biogenesis system outer membrane secretion channel CsgG